MSDFEKASLKSVKKSFPNATQRGCFFHYSQAVWKNIQKHKELLELYKNDPYCALNMKKLMAIAFVPVDDVTKAYDLLLTETSFFEDNDILNDFLIYFEATWIGGRTRSPQFSIELWNCHNSILSDLGKKNNICEGFNRALNSLLSVHDPTVFKFIQGLKRQ